MNRTTQSQNAQHKLFMREITRQLCHHTTGLPKDLSPLPVTLGDWKKCLNSLYGWVNIGIEQNVAEMFHELNIGEVIPSTPPSIDIYNYGFAPNEIGRHLGMGKDNNEDKEDKDYRAIINYYSFSRLITFMMKSKNQEYCIKFNESLKNVFTDVNPKTFWLNILITESVTEYLKENKIGEVIVKEGSSGESAMLESSIKAMKEPAVWDMEGVDEEEDEEPEVKKQNTVYPPNYHTDDLEYIDDLEDIEDFSELKVSDESEKKVEEADPTPFRLVMNNATLLNLINYSCHLNGNTHDDTNVFQLMGGEDDEFTNLFGMLQI